MEGRFSGGASREGRRRGERERREKRIRLRVEKDCLSSAAVKRLRPS